MWKWDAMDNRRPFFFIFLNLLLTFSWLELHLSLTNEKILPDHSNSDNGDQSFAPLEVVPFILFLIHGLCVLLLFFNGFSFILLSNPSRTKRLCEWSCYSSVAFCYCVYFFNEEKPTYSGTYNSVDTIFPVVCCCSMLIVHNLGLTQPLLVLLKLTYIIIWIIFLVHSVSTFDLSHSLILSFSLLHLFILFLSLLSLLTLFISL